MLCRSTGVFELLGKASGGFQRRHRVAQTVDHQDVFPRQVWRGSERCHPAPHHQAIKYFWMEEHEGGTNVRAIGVAEGNHRTLLLLHEEGCQIGRLAADVFFVKDTFGESPEPAIHSMLVHLSAR